MKDFKVKYLVFLVIICFIVVGLYYSYAIFVTKQLQENIVSIKTIKSSVELKVNNQNETITIKGNTNIIATIKLKNNGTNNYYYTLFFKGIKTGIKVTYEKEPDKMINAHEEKEIVVNISNELEEDVSLTFGVKTGFDDDYLKDIDYSYINKSQNYDHSGANKPNMSNLNLIPVNYRQVSEKEGIWYKTDINNSKSVWYDYDNGIWANAVLVSDNNYKKYQSKAIGEEIEIGDIIGFYVWIPRFKYVIMNSSNYTNFEKINNVLFESGTDSTGTVTCVDKISNLEDKHLYSEVCEDKKYSKIFDNLSTYTHPSFKDKEGFWVSKFLMGEGNNTIKSIYNVSFLKKNITDAILLSQNIIKDRSHLLTNMEYSSIVILTDSMYGKSGNSNYYSNDNYTFKRVYNNSYVNEITGCSTNYNSYSKNFVISTNKECIAYNDLTNYSHVSNSVSYQVGFVGSGASTTGTINGVYDMANISGEILASYIAEEDGSINTSARYYDLYSYDEYLGIISSSKNISKLNRYKLGDSIKENFRSMTTNGMWQGGILEQKDNNGLFLRGGNGDIKNASIYTTTIVDPSYEAPFRVSIY